MAEQDWGSSYPSAGAPPPVPTVWPALRYELRPLAAGEVLDRVFSLYRTHFWLFVGFSAVAAGVSAGTAILRLIYLHFHPLNIGTTPAAIFLNAGIAMLQTVPYLIAYSLTHAATSSAVQALYLGEPSSFETAMKVAKRVWLRCLGIAAWQTWSAVWVFLALLVPMIFLASLGTKWVWLVGLLGLGMFGSLIYGVIAYLRNSLAVPAAVVEDLGVRSSMRRSKRLASGGVGRIFLLILLVYALWFIAGLLEIPLALLLARSHAAEQIAMQAILLAVNFVATSLVGPIAAIGLCLFYFDERVRKEGFDLEVMLRGAAAPGVFVAAPVLVASAAEAPSPMPEQT